MEVDDQGVPTKSKMSKLTVVGNKETGQIGVAELDLSKYGVDEHEWHKIVLSKCKFEDALIEVGLQGMPL